MWHVDGEKICVRVFVGERAGMRLFVRHRRRWENNTEANVEKWDGRVWTGLNWLRVGTSGGLL
jgi:hypothetical protein